MQKNILQLSDQRAIIEAIQDNDEGVLKFVYKKNYPKTERLVLSNNGSVDQARDIFQEAFIAMWRQIKDQQFVPLNESALDGYLYQIAKNKWMDYLRSAYHRKTVPLENSSNHDTLPDDQERSSETEKLGLTMEVFERLKGTCKSLLSQFYFEKKSLKEMADLLNLDPASVRNKKYRCMQELRALALEKWTD
jgi:RNA polymerase sigma factor (sigma-70 family)